jgi:branched-chain amino acid transport system ATP-binding protein
MQVRYQAALRPDRNGIIVAAAKRAARKCGARPANGAQAAAPIVQALAATLALAERVHIINNGHIAHEGTTREIRARPELLERYLAV